MMTHKFLEIKKKNFLLDIRSNKDNGIKSLAKIELTNFLQ